MSECNTVQVAEQTVHHIDALEFRVNKSCSAVVRADIICSTTITKSARMHEGQEYAKLPLQYSAKLNAKYKLKAIAIKTNSDTFTLKRLGLGIFQFQNGSLVAMKCLRGNAFLKVSLRCFLWIIIPTPIPLGIDGGGHQP